MIRHVNRGVLVWWAMNDRGGLQDRGSSGYTKLTASYVAGTTDHKGRANFASVLNDVATSFAEGPMNYTVGFWFKHDISSAARTADGSAFIIMEKGGEVEDGIQMYMPSFSSELAITVAGTPVDTGSLVLVQGTWYHILVTQNNDETCVWINGSRVSQQWTNAIALSGSGLNFCPQAPGGSSYNGCFSDFRFYDSKLTDEEIASFYNEDPLMGCTRFALYDASIAVHAPFRNSQIVNEAGDFTFTMYGTLGYGSDHYGESLNAFWIAAKNACLKLSNPITDPCVSAEMWYYYGGANGAMSTLLSRNGGMTQHVVVDTSNRLGYYWDVNAGGSGFVATSATLTLNAWHHIVMTNNTGRIKFWVNGVNVMDSAGFTNGQFYGGTMNDSVDLELIANHNTSDLTQGALGRIDGLIIWRRTLDDTEAAMLYELSNTRRFYRNEDVAQMLTKGEMCL